MLGRRWEPMLACKSGAQSAPEHSSSWPRKPCCVAPSRRRDRCCDAAGSAGSATTDTDARLMLKAKATTSPVPRLPATMRPRS